MNKQNFKSFIKSINLFEVIWLLSTIIVLVIFSVCFPDIMFEDKNNVLIIICSVMSIIGNPIAEVLISKQCRWWTIFSIVFVELADIVVFFSLKVYSSCLITLLFWIPIEVLTFIKWGKNKDEKRKDMTVVKTFGVWGNVLIVLGMCALGFICGFLFKKLPNSEISYIIAFSNVFEICNGVFLLTRNDEQWFAWSGYLICQTIIWISLGHYIMLITVLSMMINTVYGFTKWRIYIKRSQKQKKKIYVGLNS